MSSRRANPAMIIPEALEPIQQLYAAAGHPPRGAPDRELCSSYTRSCCRTLSWSTPRTPSCRSGQVLRSSPRAVRLLGAGINARKE